MCGIVGYVGSRQCLPILIEGLKRLEYRGYDSAGVAVQENGKLDMVKAAGKIRQLEARLDSHPLAGIYGIAHTRWATHGEPNDLNAHPHTDASGKVMLVHNGIIENYGVLKAALKKEGHGFKTETDTEVLAHLVGKYLTRGMKLEHAVGARAARRRGHLRHRRRVRGRAGNAGGRAQGQPTGRGRCGRGVLPRVRRGADR